MTHMARVSLVVGVLVSVILIGGVAFAQSADDLRRIVTFRGLDLTAPGDLATARSVVAMSGSREVHNLWLINALAIQLPADRLDQALAFLGSYPFVVGVFDDPVAMVDGGSHCIWIDPAPASSPLPEIYDRGQQMIDVPAAWQQWPGLEGAGVTIAVLDTGIDGSHPELSPRVVGGFNALAGANPSDYMDDNGHGTHVAGIIAAALNGQGIIGVAPRSTLLAVKVVDQCGKGQDSDLIYGLQWVYHNGSPLAKLVNMSPGFPNDSLPRRQAIQRLYERGVIMVASAGNRCAADGGQDEAGGDAGEGQACNRSITTIRYPAAYHEVTAVGATDIYDHITTYTLTGPQGDQLDIAAPGGSKATGIRILSTIPGGYGWGSGTSQAAAHVTGAVALALQLQPGALLDRVLCLLRTTAEGPGRINVYNMVQALLQFQCP
jgi:subtilisin family serine protease